jgi:hypothetical protein
MPRDDVSLALTPIPMPGGLGRHQEHTSTLPERLDIFLQEQLRVSHRGVPWRAKKEHTRTSVLGRSA